MISEHFSNREIACHCGCGQMIVVPELVQMAEALREYLGVPIIVNCVNRCPKHNKEVGGETNSLHIKGMAMDMTANGIAIDRLKEIAWDLWNKNEILTGGLGLYSDFIHIDCGKKRTWRG